MVDPTTDCKVISDAEDALNFLRGSHNLPDLIFLDINMPKMDGFEFLVHLKRDQRLKTIPVIFYSTTKEESQIAKATKLSASAFVSKTNSFNSLCEVLHHFLRHESNDGKQRLNFIL